jgi:hypothetical protein
MAKSSHLTHQLRRIRRYRYGAAGGHAVSVRLSAGAAHLYVALAAGARLVFTRSGPHHAPPLEEHRAADRLTALDRPAALLAGLSQRFSAIVSSVNHWVVPHYERTVRRMTNEQSLRLWRCRRPSHCAFCRIDIFQEITFSLMNHQNRFNKSVLISQMHF